MQLESLPSDLSDEIAVRLFVDRGGLSLWVRTLFGRRFDPLRNEAEADEPSDRAADVQLLVTRLEAVQRRLAKHRASRWYRYLAGAAWLVDIRTEVFVLCLLAVCHQYLDEPHAAAENLRAAVLARGVTLHMSRAELALLLVTAAINPLTLVLRELPDEDPRLLNDVPEVRRN